MNTFSGQPYSMKGQETLLLNDPQTCWVVQSGSLALFGATVKDGMSEDTRRYLCDLGPGEACFGAATSADGQHRGLCAVASEETQLLKVSHESFRAYLTANPAEAVALVEGWVTTLDVVLADISPPAVDVQVSGAQKCDLWSGQCLHPEPGTVVWLDLHQGQARWMGIEALSLRAASGPFPMGSGMWIEADGAVELETLKTVGVRKTETLLDGLARLLDMVLYAVDQRGHRGVQEDFQRFQERERLTQQMRENALGELASVLYPQASRNPALEGSPLLVAACAVGEALGITIRAPLRSEDARRLKEPLEAIVRASHIRMRTVLLTDTWWKKDQGPLLAYTQEDHRPVALLPVSATRYELFDPVRMIRTPIRARLASTLTPVAHTFYRPFPSIALRWLDLLTFGLRGYLKDLIIVLLTGIAVTLLGMLTPQATSILIDQAIPDADRNIVLQLGFALLAAAFGQALFQLAQGSALIRQQTGVRSSTQAAMWDRLLKMKPSFFRQYATGDLQVRVTTIDTMSQALSGTTMRTLFTSFLALLNLALMLYYSVPLTLLACAVALLAILATVYSGVLTVRQVRPLQILVGELFGLMVQFINGVSKLRVAGAEERAFAYWGKKFSQQQTLRRRIQHIEDNINVFNAVLPTLVSVGLFWFAMRLIQHAETVGGSGLTAGTFLAFNVAFGTFIGGMTSLSNTIIDLLDVATLWERAKPILGGTPEVDADKADPGRLSGKLALDHVTFRYREDGHTILDDVSIRAEPGEFIALVGPSGSGKSTILRLLLGFETSESGAVYYDDQELSQLDVSAVRRQLGIVLQQSKIMAASILENIASGSQITMNEAWGAARAAGLADDITNMPMGMHTFISEGGNNLSGGQRQRLLIARALVFKPTIVFFDEATSALDNRTQALVTESLNRLRATRVVIAHRLSTIRHADRIYVVDRGRVVQQGSFDELIHQDGLFAQLMARQML